MGDASGLVFPGTKAGKPISDMTLTKLVKAMGYGVHVHGFRSTFKVWAQERTNFPREVTEAALAHTIQNKAEAAYARSDLIREASELRERGPSYIGEVSRRSEDRYFQAARIYSTSILSRRSPQKEMSYMLESRYVLFCLANKLKLGALHYGERISLEIVRRTLKKRSRSM